MYIDLRPYMNLSPAVVKDTASFSEGYHLFRTMGLRHLVVINGYLPPSFSSFHNYLTCVSRISVVGIITRKDLL